MSDSDITSPSNMDTTTHPRDEKIKKVSVNEWDYYLIQHQILQTHIIGNVWQTVRRITNEISILKGLSNTSYDVYSESI